MYQPARPRPSAAVPSPATSGVVECRSLSDPASSLTDGRLRHALGQSAAPPRAAAVVEDRHSKVFYSKVFYVERVPRRWSPTGRPSCGRRTDAPRPAPRRRRGWAHRRR
jgi:hypothetical protein